MPRIFSNGTVIDDCDMHINYLVPANSIAFLIVEYNSQVDIRVQPSMGPISVSSN